MSLRHDKDVVNQCVRCCYSAASGRGGDVVSSGSVRPSVCMCVVSCLYGMLLRGCVLFKHSWYYCKCFVTENNETEQQMLVVSSVESHVGLHGAPLSQHQYRFYICCIRDVRVDCEPVGLGLCDTSTSAVILMTKY